MNNNNSSTSPNEERPAEWWFAENDKRTHDQVIQAARVCYAARFHCPLPEQHRERHVGKTKILAFLAPRKPPQITLLEGQGDESRENVMQLTLL